MRFVTQTLLGTLVAALPTLLLTGLLQLLGVGLSHESVSRGSNQIVDVASRNSSTEATPACEASKIVP